MFNMLSWAFERRSQSLVERDRAKTLKQLNAPNYNPGRDEVLQEANRTTNPANKDPIKGINLVKNYSNGFQALRDITFGVEKAQIFGLLGPNGAGKSTTFNILTTLIPKTSGKFEINGVDLNHVDPKIFEHIGICPQFNNVWDVISVREHLKIFSMLKGLTPKEQEENAIYYSHVLSLDDHIEKRAKALSGGNKRKLCVANSLIGASRIQFFDEPSSGLDPLARKFLWETITQNLESRGSSIIFTTHSMSEAESLCHKIGKFFVCFFCFENL